jgi:hypothetical protein
MSGSIRLEWVAALSRNMQLRSIQIKSFNETTALLCSEHAVRPTTNKKDIIFTGITFMMMSYQRCLPENEFQVYVSRPVSNMSRAGSFFVQFEYSFK